MNWKKILLTLLVPILLSSYEPTLAKDAATTTTVTSPSTPAKAPTTEQIFQMIKTTRAKLGLGETKLSKSPTMQQIAFGAVKARGTVKRLHQDNLIAPYLKDEGYVPKSYAIISMKLAPNDNILAVLRLILTNEAGRTVLMEKLDVELAIYISGNMVGLMLLAKTPEGLGI